MGSQWNRRRGLTLMMAADHRVHLKGVSQRSVSHIEVNLHPNLPDPILTNLFMHHDFSDQLVQCDSVQRHDVGILPGLSTLGVTNSNLFVPLLILLDEADAGVGFPCRGKI